MLKSHNFTALKNDRLSPAVCYTVRMREEPFVFYSSSKLYYQKEIPSSQSQLSQLLNILNHETCADIQTVAPSDRHLHAHSWLKPSNMLVIVATVVMLWWKAHKWDAVFVSLLQLPPPPLYPNPECHFSDCWWRYHSLLQRWCGILSHSNWPREKNEQNKWI